MRFAVQTWGTDLDAVKAYARDAEAMGYDALWYGDGLWPWTHEGWTVLAALATLTRRIRLGPAVTYLLDRAYRHPSLLAQLGSSLDWLSGGRVDLRMGLGTSAPEAAAVWRRHGIEYPDAVQRLDGLREGLQVVKALWTGKPVEFSGRYYTLSGAQLTPTPLQRPHPPIWVAAMGEWSFAEFPSAGRLRLLADRARPSPPEWEWAFLCGNPIWSHPLEIKVPPTPTPKTPPL